MNWKEFINFMFARINEFWEVVWSVYTIVIIAFFVIIIIVVMLVIDCSIYSGIEFRYKSAPIYIVPLSYN